MKLNTTASNPNMSDNRDVMELVKTILDELERIEEGDIRGGAGRTIIREEVTEDNQSFRLGMMDRFIQAGKDLDVHLSNGKWISPDEYNIDQNNVLTFVNQKSICKKGDVIFFTPNLGRLVRESDSEYMKHLRNLWDYLHTAEVDKSTIRARETILANREITGMVNIDSIRGNHLHNILGYIWRNMEKWNINTSVEYDDANDEYVMPNILPSTKNLATMNISNFVKPSKCYIALADIDPLYNISHVKLGVSPVLNIPYTLDVSGEILGYQTCLSVFKTGVNIKNISISLIMDSTPIDDECMVKFKNIRIYEIDECMLNTIGTIDELSDKSLIELFPFCQDPITPVLNPSIINIGKSSLIHEVCYTNQKVSFKGANLPVLDIKMFGHTTKNLINKISKDMYFSKNTSHLMNIDATCELGIHKSDSYTINFTMSNLSRPDEIEYPPKLYLIFDNDFNTATYIGNLPIRNGRHALTFKVGGMKTKSLTGIMIDDACIKSGFSVRLRHICIINNTWDDKSIAMNTPYIEPNTLFSTSPVIKLNQYQIRLDDKDLKSLPNGTRDELFVRGRVKTRIDRVDEFIVDKDHTSLLDAFVTNTHIPLKLEIPNMCRSTSFKEDLLCADIPIIDIIYPQLSLVDKHTPTYIGVTIDGDVILNINIRNELRNGSIPAVYEWLEEKQIKIHFKLNNPRVSTGTVDDINIASENVLDKYSMGILIPGGLTLSYNSKNPNAHSIRFEAELYKDDVIYPTTLGVYNHLSNWLPIHNGNCTVTKVMNTHSITAVGIEVPNYIESVDDVIVCGVEGETPSNLYIDKRDGSTYIVFEVSNSLIEQYGINSIIEDKDFRALIKREHPLITEIQAIGSLAITDDSNTFISSSDSGILPVYDISVPANVKGAIDTFVAHNVRNSKSTTEVSSQQNVVNNVTNNQYINSPNYIINSSMQVWEGINNRIIKSLRNNIPLASMFTWYNIDTNTDNLSAEYIDGHGMRITMGRDDEVLNNYSETHGTVVYNVPADTLELLRGKEVTLSFVINGSFDGEIVQEVYQMISGPQSKIKNTFDLSKERRSVTFIMGDDVSLCNLKWHIHFPEGINSCNYIDIADIKLEIGNVSTPYYPTLYVDELTRVSKYMECVDCELMGEMYAKPIVVKGIKYYATDIIKFANPKIKDNPTIIVNYEYGDVNIAGMLKDRYGFRIVVHNDEIPIRLKNYSVFI